MDERVLYVEDDADTGDLFKTWLGIHGCEVTSVQTSAEALELARGGDFDIYILDNWLPDGNGVELCKRIRTFDPNTPIVFVSGAAYESDKDQGIAAGAQAYVTKPVELIELHEIILRLLRKEHLELAK